MGDAGTLTMSARELNRLEVLGRVLERRLTQRDAAERLDLSLRQVERLCRALRDHGAAGLVSRQRGRPSNHKIPAAVRVRAVDLVRTRYCDFGPTFACEKLREQHDLSVSVETLRQWMSEDGIWVPRAQRARRPQPPRYRRPCLGELVQIDGCDHEWFEDRGPRCTLLVYVDDATSRLMELRFVVSESAFSYFASTKRYLEEHGKPVAFYSDKASIFRVVDARGKQARGDTQFGRALSELNIDSLCANTPQAKGRVERAHLTLQDRLVKELRLRGISTPEAGNAYVPEFAQDYNERFSREPQSPHDAHRPVRDGENLDQIFTWQEDRKLSKNLTVHYKRILYIVEASPEAIPLAGKPCRIYEPEQGPIEIRCQGTLLPSRIFHDKNPHVRQGAIVENKRLATVLTKIRDDQRERDSRRLASHRLSLRDKERIRKAQGRANHA
jgi:transposase